MGSKIILPFDMSLRLWSASVPFNDLGVRMGVPVTILHEKGRQIAGNGRLSGRLAHRHYTSLAQEKGTTFSDVIGWLSRTITKVEADGALVRLLETRQVEALFWIAIFGRDPVPTPTLDPDLISLIERLHSRALIENYTDRGPDCPTKTWFPVELGEVAT